MARGVNLKDQEVKGNEGLLNRRVGLRAVCGGAALWLEGCSGDTLRAGGYESKEIPQLGSVELPGGFALVAGLAERSKKLGAGTPLEVTLLGEMPVDPLEANLWGITTLFAFHEKKGANGTLRAEANLILSRLADQQAFAGAQTFYEYAARVCPDAWWKQASGLNWKQEVAGKTEFVYTAVLDERQPRGGQVVVLLDREHLVQAMLVGEGKAFDLPMGRAILQHAAKSLAVRMAIEDYFARVGKAAARQADLRRKNYIRLLETLEREQLDYSPTPKAVIFNRNLACQFWWPAYDRSGVPASFAIVGRIGKLRMAGAGPGEFAEVLAGMEGIRLFAADPGEREGQWALRKLDGGKEPLERSRAVVDEAGWVAKQEERASLVFASLEFSFDDKPMDLSGWLDNLERVAKQSARAGLVEAA